MGVNSVFGGDADRDEFELSKLTESSLVGITGSFASGGSFNSIGGFGVDSVLDDLVENSILGNSDSELAFEQSEIGVDVGESAMMDRLEGGILDLNVENEDMADDSLSGLDNLSDNILEGVGFGDDDLEDDFDALGVELESGDEVGNNPNVIYQKINTQKIAGIGETFSNKY